MPETRMALHVDVAAPVDAAAPVQGSKEAQSTDADQAHIRSQLLQSRAVSAVGQSVSRASQTALEVVRSPVDHWEPCSDLLRYDVPDQSLSGLHVQLLKAGLRVLVYSGDHDMVIPHTGSREWVWALGLPQDAPLLPWKLNGQVRPVP